MNILFVFDKVINRNAGGVERVTCLLSKGFKDKGHNVTFLSVGESEGREENDNSEDFCQFHIPSSSHDFGTRLRDLLAQRKIDVVVFQGNPDAVVAALNETPENITKFLVLHNQPFSIRDKEKVFLKLTPSSGLSRKRQMLNFIGRINLPFYRRIYLKRAAATFRNIIDQTEKFILLSERYIPRLLRDLPDIDSSKVISIINPNTFPIPQSEPVKEKIVLFVGRLSNPQKNVTGFIDVWKQFSKTHPEWEAIVLGDGEHKEYIEDYAKKKKVGNISFLGNKSNVQGYYAKAKILCMTSAYEGWPMVLAEAMAYECVPAVYDSFEAVHDIIINGETGLVVPFNDASRMAAALASLADDEPRRKRMALEGKKKILDFEIDNIIPQWEELFRQYNK